jgi:hypothetical protein
MAHTLHWDRKMFIPGKKTNQNGNNHPKHKKMKNLILFFVALTVALQLSGQPVAGIAGTPDTTAMQTTGIVPSDPTGYSLIPLNAANSGTEEVNAPEVLKNDKSQDMGENTAGSRNHFNTIMTNENEMGGEGFRIYTNLNTLFIRCSARTGNNGTVTVFDLVGKEVYTSELTDTPLNKFRLDLNKGYYIVKVVTGMEVQTQKILLSN